MILSGKSAIKYEYRERFASYSGKVRTLCEAPPISELASRILTDFPALTQHHILAALAFAANRETMIKMIAA